MAQENSQEGFGVQNEENIETSATTISSRKGSYPDEEKEKEKERVQVVGDWPAAKRLRTGLYQSNTEIESALEDLIRSGNETLTMTQSAKEYVAALVAKAENYRGKFQSRSRIPGRFGIHSLPKLEEDEDEIIAATVMTGFFSMNGSSPSFLKELTCTDIKTLTIPMKHARDFVFPLLDDETMKTLENGLPIDIIACHGNDNENESTMQLKYYPEQSKMMIPGIVKLLKDSKGHDLRANVHRLCISPFRHATGKLCFSFTVEKSLKGKEILT